MNKLLKSIAFGLMIVALVVTAATIKSTKVSADCSITANIAMKASGANVTCLQTKLGVTPATGYFGSITKAAVIAYQTAHGISTTGTVGPLTRASLNGAAAVVTGNFPAGCSSATGFSSTTGASCATVVASFPAGCSSATGFSSTTGASCAVATSFPAGCTSSVGFSTTTGASCNGAAAAGATYGSGSTDGSISASTSSYVSSGISLKKGETKDVVAVRLQATDGPVKVNRVDVTFNVRPWLFFGTVALHDNAGHVLATKTLSSIADTTELTVGSLYQVRFDGLNYVVTPGTNPDLALSTSVLPATDKIPSGGQSVTSTFSAMRTTSEVGYVDAPTVSQANTVTLTSTGSVADVYSRIAPSSPLTGQQVVNANNTTTDVNLGAFSLKSTNNSATLNTLLVTIGGTATASTDFSNFRLYVGGSSIAGGTLSGATITFSNLTAPLATDAWVDFTIKADIAAASSGTVNLALNPTTSNVVVTDANYGTATIESGSRTSNTLTLTQNSVTVSATSAHLGAAIVQSNITTGYNATYAFTLTNNSNNDLYVSATPGTFVTTTTTGGATAATSALTSVTVDPSTVSGDDASGTYYAIPTGSARTFTFAAVLRGANAGATMMKATVINYGTTTSGTGSTITSGLSALNLNAAF